VHFLFGLIFKPSKDSANGYFCAPAHDR